MPCPGRRVNQSHVLFDRFVQATTCKGTLKAFQELCDFLELKPNEYRVFYHKLKSKLNYWKAKALWAKLDKRASHKEYKKGRSCANTKCLIIGAGPCGLRTAIELGFLGAKVVLLEKRDAFSRNNVLHLWPFTIHDLRGLGAKKFYGKFCAGAIDHISIRQLQLMLLKVALLLGIEIHVNMEFKGLIEPPEDQENERIGWRAEVHPRTHPVNELEFDVIIGADGRRNTLSGFKRKEFRGKLAIAITANFINRNTTAEAKVEEISGVAFIFNQKFFQDLREATGIDLENIVYYKDDTHYFVMTAKKQSLLEKGVILHDYADTEMLLSRANVDQKALLSYAREAADFSTNHQLPKLDFAINHYGQPDVAMFDFTCMYASENAALVRQRNAHKLLVALVGDSLLEPFWPMGTGIARGFLAAMDAAWMVRSWAHGSSPLEVLAERESIYRLLPQTTPENVSKNFSQYSVNPTTRYPNISLHQVRPNQVRHLLDTGETRDLRVDMENVVNSSSPKLTRNESIVRSSKLLNWCQRQTERYRGVSVSDLTTCWKSGLALCALIHCYRPDLIDFDSLDEKDVEKNNQLAFDVAEKEFGISPIMTGKEMSVVVEPDKLSMVMYLSQFYEMFKDTLPPELQRVNRDDRPSIATALAERKIDSAAAVNNNNKVKVMATQLLAKFEENAPTQSTGLKRQGSLRKEFPQNIGGSDVCFFCRKRVYVMERLSAEGKFFHRSCFKCDYCGTTLRLSSYAFDVEDGMKSIPIYLIMSNRTFPRLRVLMLKVPIHLLLKLLRYRPSAPNLFHNHKQRLLNLLSSLSLVPALQQVILCLQYVPNHNPATSHPHPSPQAPLSGLSQSQCQTRIHLQLTWTQVTGALDLIFNFLLQKTYTEEELNAKLTRRVQKAARRQAKQEELKRLHRAQIIQRQLEQVEEKQRQLEERGVAVEKALRGEAGMGKKDDPKLMQEWFKLVQEKNALVRYESELMIFARELELEDRQSRLQQELRERMATEEELAEEKQILNEMLEVVEQRDSLVALLEEQRLREKEEDKDLESVMLSKGFNLNWA
uniref:F-actin monooxygenase n=1 Tax=Sinocyclocheilus anshuiensis TaxID=1608454 RepID=A0A671S4A8_9TELE